MSGLFLLFLTNLIIGIFGLLLVLKETRQRNLSVLFLVLDENDKYVEDLVRFAIRKIKVKSMPNRLVIFYGFSGADTAAIVTRLAGDLSFEARDLWNCQAASSLSNILDLREYDRKEKKLMIEGFFEKQKLEYQYSCIQ